MKPINITIANEEERKTILNALNHYGHYCLDRYDYAAQGGARYSRAEMIDIKRRSDLCFAIQERIYGEINKAAEEEESSKDLKEYFDNHVGNPLIFCDKKTFKKALKKRGAKRLTAHLVKYKGTIFYG